MSTTPWVSKTHPIKDGEQVKAQVANRHPSELQQRTQHLKDRLDSIGAGEALYVHNVKLASPVQVGHVVYWDSVDSDYKSAYANVTFNPGLGAYTISPTSFAVGVVTQKFTSTTGDVLLFGFLRDFDFTNLIGTPGNTAPEAGAYYLTSNPLLAGRCTKQKPPVGIYVGFLRGDGSAHINPTPREVLEDHVHFAFDLYSTPAGVLDCPLTSNEKYAFVSTDNSLPGWLPANDPIFGGLAPLGAVYGYNISQHPELDRVWPPIPTNNVYLEMEGVGVKPGTWSVDQTTIWWYDACYGHGPWPVEPDPCGNPSSSNSFCSYDSVAASSCALDAPLEEEGFVRIDPCGRGLRIYFTKMIFKTSDSMVTSLKSKTGSPIIVENCDGNPATTGDLQLSLDLNLALEQDTDDLYVALKTIEDQKFKQGKIVSGLKAGTNVTITPTPGKGELLSGVYYGQLTIDADLAGADTREGAVSLVALNGVREDTIDDIFFLSLPAGEDTSLRGRIEIPREGLVVSPKLQVWFWVLGLTTGAIPDLTLSYRILSRPVDCTTTQTLPGIGSEITIDTLSGCAVPANDYAELTSSPDISISEGDLVFFTLSRAGSTDGYTADVGILRMGFRITS
jgi:hypothetical protein